MSNAGLHGSARWCIIRTIQDFQESPILVIDASFRAGRFAARTARPTSRAVTAVCALRSLTSRYTHKARWVDEKSREAREARVRVREQPALHERIDR